jgi:hypothetical protein
MSGDFLSRLADRALGVAATVQPLIAPTFARAPAVASDAPEPVIERATQAPMAEQPPRAVDRAFQTIYAAAEHAEPALIESHAAEPQPARQSEAQPFFAPPPERITAHGLAPKPPVHSAPLRSQPDVTRAAALPSRAQSNPAQPTTVHAARPREQAGIGHPRHAEKSERMDSASAPAPVHVTIDRIEVRAMLPPLQTTTRPGSPAPKGVLTLEEYTKQRSRGER